MNKQNRRSMRNARRSFTLIEIVVVIVILVTLAGVATPMYMNHLKKANVGAAKTQINLLEDALSSYRLDVGTYPSDLQGLVQNIDESEKWDGPYIKKIPMDPWGTPYYYAFPGEHGEYDLVSFGGDKQEGGENENADLNNWD